MVLVTSIATVANDLLNHVRWGAGDSGGEVAVREGAHGISAWS